MRSNCADYVDAGYLLAAAATRVTGTSMRAGVDVDYQQLVEALIRHSEASSDLTVLRVNWYDSADRGVPDEQQVEIGKLPRVKLRLGRFSYDGKQKGVDIRIGLDLTTHARNGVADVFYLVSGDDDLTEAVEEAQHHGVRVVILAVPRADDRAHGVSTNLHLAADDVEVLSPTTIDQTVKPVKAPAEAAQEVPPPAVTGTPSAPSPLDLANRPKPERPVAPVGAAYSGTTGYASQVGSAYVDPADDVIDGVVTRVLETFKKTASPVQLGELTAAASSRRTIADDRTRGHFTIPFGLDRVLLLDASDVLNDYDIPQSIRHALRERFWDLIPKVI